MMTAAAADQEAPLAPELTVARWFNTPQPLTLAALRGRVVLLHAFQMLCPGCVSHGTPQAEKAHRLFRGSDVQVIALQGATAIVVPAPRIEPGR